MVMLMLRQVVRVVNGNQVSCNALQHCDGSQEFCPVLKSTFFVTVLSCKSTIV
jgi:hypothetical protein